CAHTPSAPTPPSNPSGIYFVMVDRFANGDPSNDLDADPTDPQAFHGGDLTGLITRLDWIRDLGFDTVWLSPIFSMRTSKWHGFGAFHGYWTYDLGALEPRFGDELLLAQLRRELDRRHMKLYLDVVLNHVGPDAPLVTQHPDWFHRRGGVTDWNDATQLVMNDVHGLPDLATEKPEVFEHLRRSAQKWIDLAKPDGFRLDAVKHLPLDFWAKFNGSLEIARLGELLDGDPSLVAKTWREGRFTSMFDFPLGFAIADVFCRGESPAKLGAILTNDRRYPDPSQLVTLVDNHDLSRIVSLCGGDLEKVKQALAFMILMRGTPSLTWGTEVGLDGAKEPDNRKSMQFIEHPLRAHLSSLMKQRASSSALSQGAALPVELSAERLVIARIAPDGTTTHVTVSQGRVTVADAPKSSRERFTQWRTGAQKQKVLLTGRGSVVGSGAEFGDWDKAKAHALPYEVELPLHGVFEFKRILDGEWEQGPNRVIFVTPELHEVRW
ncbi:MAG TPA: alpha-amylase family glycosyl hydrolase, partial [Archangium sp.]